MYTAYSLVKCKFQSRSKIYIHSRCPFTGLPEMRDNTATIVPISGIFRLIPCVQQHLITGTVAMNCRKSCSLAHKVCYSLHKAIRTILMNPYAKPRLMGPYTVSGLKAHV